MADAETIVAVSTPAGYAPRAVVRLSGPVAVETVAARFRPGDERDWTLTFRATPGMLRLAADGLEVPVTVYVMRAPHSYTREDVVEIHLPGSPPLLDMVLDDLLTALRQAVRLAHRPEPFGLELRLARPGEFTERAFLNGRIDLSQAEAVLAVIRSRSEAELLAATARLDGQVSLRCAAVQDEIAELRALIEAALDFAEHGIDLVSQREALASIGRIRDALQNEVEQAPSELASDGRLHVVICGPPNAGKSSLLNRLAGEEVALVHHAPGTTRDPVRSEIEVKGVHFAVTDTAGLQTGGTDIEEAAVRKARRLAGSAHLLVLVLDGSQAAAPDALDVARAAAPNRVLCVVNKCDLPQVLDEARLQVSGVAGEIVHTSALTGEGIDGLREALGRVVFEGRLDASAADCLFNARQRDAARRTVRHLEEAEGAVRDGLGYEFVALHLREATDALGEITGEVGAQDVLDRIFSRFCIGK